MMKQKLVTTLTCLPLTSEDNNNCQFITRMQRVSFSENQINRLHVRKNKKLVHIKLINSLQFMTVIKYNFTMFHKKLQTTCSVQELH